MKININIFKKIKLALLFLAVLATGCESFDEPKPGTINPDVFFETQSDAMNSVTACYQPLFGNTQKYYAKAMHVLCGVGSDNMGDGFGGIPSRKEMDRFKFDPQYGNLKEVWWNAYRGINKSLLVIERVGTMDDNVFDSPELKKRLIAEAHFLKALNYFNLIRLFGDVPFHEKFVDDPVGTTSIKRTGVEFIYDEIIKDLEIAAEDLWDKTKVEAGRATSGAAKLLMAKVYLTRAGWRLDAKTNEMVKGDSKYYNDAITWVQKLQDEGIYGLRDNYREVFPASEEEQGKYENNEEHVFFIPCTLEKQFFEVLLYWGPRKANGEGGFSSFVGEVEFTSSFEPEDLREPVVNLHYIVDEFEEEIPLDETETKYWWPGMNIPHPGKYLPDEDEYTYPPSGNAWGSDLPIFRYAEALLILAEADNESNSGPTAVGIEAFNQVRRRAGLSEWPQVKDLNGNIRPNTYEGFQAAVRQEWRWELCYENKRLFDLRRWNILEKTFKDRALVENPTPQDLLRAQNVEQRHNLFPIPLGEIQKCPNLFQNPGF